MNRSLLIGLLFGAALFTALIVWFGAAEVLSGVVAIGWGVVLVSLFRFFLLIFDTLSWRAVIAPAERFSLVRFFWIRWIGDSVNTLLPVARIGGEFLRAHMAHRRGMNGALAGAGVMVDVTAGIMTQFLFSIVGVLAFVLLASGNISTTESLVAGLVLFGAGLAAFYALQRSGPFLRLARFTERVLHSRSWDTLIDSAAALDSKVLEIYRDHRAVILCCFWRIVGWVAGAGEVWLILYLLGHPVSAAEAFVLESLGQAARSAGFLIPGGLGIQEGGLVLIGSQMGLTPELALSLSLIKRVRELMVGIPGLVAWQIDTGTSIWSHRNGTGG